MQSKRAWMGAGRGRAVLSGLQLGRDAQTGTSFIHSKRPLCQPVLGSFLAGVGVLFIMMTCGCGAIIMTCGCGAIMICCCSGCIAYCGAYCCGCGEIGAGRARVSAEARGRSGSLRGARFTTEAWNVGLYSPLLSTGSFHREPASPSKVKSGQVKSRVAAS